jgi:streptogramin lyase
MTTLGTSGSSLPTSVVINEYTTAVDAYIFLASQQTYFNGAPEIGGTITSLQNTQKTVTNYLDILKGSLLSTVPASSITQITAIANILASCVEDSGNGFPSCSTLETDSKSTFSNGTTLTPTNTLMSIASIVENSTTLNNSSGILTLASTQTTLSTSSSLSSIPTSLPPATSTTSGGSSGGGSTFGGASTSGGGGSGGGSSGGSSNTSGTNNITTISVGDNPGSIAVDGAGNVWIAVNGGVQVIPNGSNTPSSLLSLSGFGVNQDTSLAINTQGEIFAQGYEYINIVELKSGQPSLISSLPVGNQISIGPIALDGNGNVWSGTGIATEIVDNTLNANINTQSVCNAGGNIAIDGGGNVWVTDSGQNSVCELPLTTIAELFNIIAQQKESSLTIDTNGQVWLTYSVTELSPVGSVNPITPITVGNSPAAIAIDGNGNIWVANSGSNNVSELSAGKNFTFPGFHTPEAIAVDGNNNIWIGEAGGIQEIPSGSSPSAPLPSEISLISLSGQVVQGVAVDGTGTLWATGGTVTGYVFKIQGIASKTTTPIMSQPR